MRDVTHNLFYIPPDKIQGDSLIITGAELHHLRNVLRRKPGDILILTDGLGCRIEARIRNTDRREISARILSRNPVEPAPSTVLDLALAPLKGARTDLIIEKGTELGIRRFILYASHNSVVKELAKGKIERYRKIALSAMLQSQRYFLPEFVIPGGWPQFLDVLSSYDLSMAAEPSGGSVIPLGKKKIVFVVGPEGGLSELELTALQKTGVLPVSLGQARLRSETAALVGIVKILTANKIL